MPPADAAGGGLVGRSVERRRTARADPSSQRLASLSEAESASSDCAMLLSSVASSACSRTSDTCWRRRPSSASTSSRRRSASACAAWRDSDDFDLLFEAAAQFVVGVGLRRAARGNGRSCSSSCLRSRDRPRRPLRRTTRAPPAACRCSQAIWRHVADLRVMAAAFAAAARRSPRPPASTSYCCDCARRVELREQVRRSARAVGDSRASASTACGSAGCCDSLHR